MEKFWLVWTPHNPQTPTKRYTSQIDAEADARIMATKYPEKGYFIVLEAKSVSQMQTKAFTLNLSQSK